MELKKVWAEEHKFTLSIKGVDICFGVDKQNKYSLHFLSLILKKCKEKRDIKNKITQ